MKRHAYTLVEVLIAGALLVIGISAAALLANSFFLQEEANAKIIRAVNLQEQASRLYQLGLNSNTITNILPERCVSTNPPDPNGFYLEFTLSTNVITNVGTMEAANCRLVFPAARQRDGTVIYDTNQVTLVRPTIR